MLVLTRKKFESILINSEIEIIVTSVRKNQVRLGVIAPAHILVQRKELADRPIHRTVRGSKILDFHSPEPIHALVGNLR